MTPFEQQVAEALAPLIASEGLGLPPWMAKPTAEGIAPRVAAAIEAAARLDTPNDVFATANYVVEDRREAALAALRGEDVGQ